MTLSSDLLNYASTRCALYPQRCDVLRAIASAIDSKHILRLSHANGVGASYLLNVVVDYLVTTGRNVAVLYPRHYDKWTNEAQGSEAFIASELLAVMDAPRQGRVGDAVDRLHRFRSADVYVVMDATATPQRLLDMTRPTAVWVGSFVSQTSTFARSSAPLATLDALHHPNVVAGETVIPGAVCRAYVDSMLSDCRRVETAGDETFSVSWRPGEVFEAGEAFKRRVLGI